MKAWCALALIAGIVVVADMAEARQVDGPFGPLGPVHSGATWSTTDLRTGTPLPGGERIINKVKVAWQIGNYWSGGLRIYGLVCKPLSLSGPLPVAILNHGLEVEQPTPGHFEFPAIKEFGLTGCTNMAAHGWLTAISTYRGEYIRETVTTPSLILGGPPRRPAIFKATSEGALELCKGEVDDVLNLLTAVRKLPEANPHRVLMWGHSHGSCITERAIERGAPVGIAVSINGPTDFTTWSNNNPLLAPTLAEQQARSSAYPGNHPETLAGLHFLRIHAIGDVVVTPDQGCALAARLPSVAAFYLNSAVTPPGSFVSGPPQCAGFTVPWLAGQLLPDAGGPAWVSPSFLMYSGLNHVTILVKSWPEFASFVNTVTASEAWNATIPATFSVMEN